jgi:putative ABC transport system permease protein
MAATTTLTLGLVMHGVTSQPYQTTRAATVGPDVVASVSANPRPAAKHYRATPKTSVAKPADINALKTLAGAPGVTDHSGPYPLTTALLGVHGLTVGAEVEGRDRPPAPVDQPKVTEGSWIRYGAVVVERSFAYALGVHVGDSVTLNGRTFEVAGVAVSAAFAPYPELCKVGCHLDYPQLTSKNTGLMWLTRTDASSLATPAAPLSYLLNLKLADPASAPAFSGAHGSSNPASTTLTLTAWQHIGQQDAALLSSEQLVLLLGSWLLALLAVASIAVLVGGRLADQMRRVGLLKAVGATPGLVAAVLLAEHLALALVAAAAGVAVGWLAAPLLSDPGAGLLGTAGAPPLTVATVVMVAGAALVVAAAASLVPALRAARTSTVGALADAARSPQRKARLIQVSARLPIALLLGVRVAARRPRRVVLGALSIAVTVSGIVTVLLARARFDTAHLEKYSGLRNPATDRVNQVLFVITVMLVALAAINAIFITRATEADSKHASAVTRAMGATPQQITAGLSLAQVLPALAGVAVGIPGGIGLYASVKQKGAITYPSVWWLIALGVGTLIIIAGLTALPARIAARRPVAAILQSEAV